MEDPIDIFTLEKILDFIKSKDDKYKSITDKDLIILLFKHFQYRTCDWYIKDKEVIGFVRYNLSRSGKTMEVIDLMIDDSNGYGVIRYFLRNNWVKWPRVRYISFQRRNKYPYRKKSIYRMRDITGGYKDGRRTRNSTAKTANFW